MVCTSTVAHALENIEQSYRLREQVVCWEAKVVEGNEKLESYQSEFVASHQQLGIAKGLTRGANLFPMTSQTRSFVSRINSSRC